jgi:hypothetical protein
MGNGTVEVRHWIATNRDGHVYAYGYHNKPVRCNGYWFGMGIILDDEDLRQLPYVPTWEDEPVLEDFDPWQ